MLVLGIVQARMGSSRLPDKMLMDLGGHLVLEYLCEELHRSRLGENIVVATTIDHRDEPIAEFCLRENISCFRGEVEDVLGRFTDVVRMYSPDHVVRLTGDNPLLPAAIVDLTIDEHLQSGADYTFTGAYYSGLTSSFPDGWDVEILRAKALLQLGADARDSCDREHVTRLALRDGVSMVKRSLQAPAAYAYPQVKLTLDDRVDLERIRRYYNLVESGVVDRLELPRWIATESIETIK